jgi:DNA-binding CsgD family transcriptional regulator
MGSQQNNKVSFSDNLVRTIFESLSAHIAIIDENGGILETNRAWKLFSMANGMPENINFNQMNYLHVCEAATREETEDAFRVAQGIRQVIDGKIKEFRYDYPCHSPEGRRWFYMRVVPMADQGNLRLIISHEDITELKLAQEALTAHQAILEEKNQSLEEVNIALKVLIRQRETDKSDMENKILTNVKSFVLPYIKKLKESRLSEKDRTLVQILDDQLKDIISPLIQRLSNAHVLLTPQEMQVATLVKDGRTTSEIAQVLFVSEATVSFHRKNLRVKLGLKNKQTNLRSFLLSMS